VQHGEELEAPHAVLVAEGSRADGHSFKDARFGGFVDEVADAVALVAEDAVGLPAAVLALGLLFGTTVNVMLRTPYEKRRSTGSPPQSGVPKELRTKRFRNVNDVAGRGSVPRSTVK
jgi:hypothetical protein